MNVERNGGFIPEPIAEAYIALWNHYEDSTQHPLTREQLTTYGAILAALQPGITGQPALLTGAALLARKALGELSKLG